MGNERDTCFGRSSLQRATWLAAYTLLSQKYTAKGTVQKKVAWRTGEQLVVQPEWAESDKKFGRKKTMLSASVQLTDRVMNELSMYANERGLSAEVSNSV